MSASITLSGLSCSTRDGTPLFTDKNMNFGPGRTGLVGRNGCGKTTLLRLLGGEIETATRTVAYHGHGRMKAAAWRRRWVSRRAFPASSVCCAAREPPRTRARRTGPWRNGSALRSPASVWPRPTRGNRLRYSAADSSRGLPLPASCWRPLISCCSTNLPTISTTKAAHWSPVAGRLRDWRGCVVVASHDRMLLENVDAIVELANGTASRVGGPWSEFAAFRSAWLAAASLTLIARNVRRAARLLHPRRCASDRPAATVGDELTALRGMHPSCCSTHARSGRSARPGRGNRIAERRQIKVATARAEARAAVEILAPLRIDLPEPPRTDARPVLSFEVVTFDIGAHRVLGPLDLLVRRGERVAITGPISVRASGAIRAGLKQDFLLHVERLRHNQLSVAEPSRWIARCACAAKHAG